MRRWPPVPKSLKSAGFRCATLIPHSIWSVIHPFNGKSISYGKNKSMKLTHKRHISGKQLFDSVCFITSPREPYTLVWGPSSSHTKIFRVQRARLKTGGNYNRFLVNFAPTDSLDIALLATVRFASSRSWQIYETLTYLPPRWWMPHGLLWFGHVIWVGIC